MIGWKSREEQVMGEGLGRRSRESEESREDDKI